MINFIRFANNIKLGDYLHQDGTIDNIPSKDIIGVCVIPSNFLPDRKARFISMAAMDPSDIEKGNHKKERFLVWYYDRGNFECNFLVQRGKVPLDTKSKGIINKYSDWGRLPLLDSSCPYLTIINPQDPGTKYYYKTTNRIPSPYAPDGSFNSNFHYRGSEKDEWALTDYRGDLNTRKIVYSIDPREECCPAFYCCERFSPGYKDREWYLPAIGELAFIPPRFEIIRGRMWEAINAGSPGVAISTSLYWSSSEYNHGSAWYVSLYYGDVGITSKDYSCCIRAFLAI